MNDREMIHDFVAGGPPTSTNARAAARAALQVEIGQASERARRGRQLTPRRLLPTLSVALVLGLAALFIVNPLLQGSGQSTAAAAVLRAASTVAARQPGHMLGPGEYSYTRTEGAYFNEVGSDGHTWGALVRTTREAWIALDGSGRLHQTSQPPEFLAPADRTRWVAAGSPSLAALSETYDRRFGPGGLAYPLDIDGFSHDQLLRLADDPSAMGAAIRAQAEKSSNPLGWEMLTIVGDLLSESVAPPQLRASLYQVATTVPGIQFVGTVMDRAGRHGVAVAVSRDDLRAELLFDPKTSRLLASEQTIRRPMSDTAAPVGTPISYTLYLDSKITRSLTGG